MYEWIEPIYKPKMERIGAEREARGRAEGRAEGEARGKALGIIGMGRDLKLSDETILSSLISRLSLSRDDAERLLREA